MNSDDRRRALQILGLDVEANEADVLAAYHRRRALYEAGNLATYSLLSDEERRHTLLELEEAFKELTADTPEPVPSPKPRSKPPEPSRRPEVPVGPEPDRESSPGAYLQYHRRARGLSLSEVTRETKIIESRLRAIESEDTDVLPVPVYVRGFVVSLAQLLELPEPEALARTYLSRIDS